jgi:hypothetical protein
MPDNWAFVAAAYGLTAVVLGLYWRRLVRQEKELATRKQPRSGSAPSVAERSREPSRTGHPRVDPDAKPSLPK